MSLPLATILIPAYRPDERLTATLQTLNRQSCQRFAVTLSYDFAPGHTPPPLPQMGVPLQVLHQTRNLGWVGNVNALLATVTTPCFMILAHDDGLSERFVEATLAVLDHAPDVVVAHGTTRHSGVVRNGELATTPSISGDVMGRLTEFIARHPHKAELGWRGMTRSAVLQKGMHLRTKRSDGQFSNTLWAMELLLHGNSAHVPDVFYEKITEADGLSRAFVHRSPAEKAAMLADNLACAADALHDAPLAQADRTRVLQDYALWLLSLPGSWNVLADAPRAANGAPDLRVPFSHFMALALTSLTTPERRD